MSDVIHDWPHHDDCRGCKIMEETRRQLRFLEDPIDYVVDERAESPNVWSAPQVKASDMKLNELRSLLREVITSPNIVYLEDDLFQRISEALAQ